MGKAESYNQIFPKALFQAKLASPVPDWMREQIETDFKEVQPVTVQALEKAYEVIRERLQNPIFLYHYRIIDNELYKYVPPKGHFSYRDTFYEKSLKTLLSHVSLPDLDFIICPMDGIPENIVCHDFYWMDDPRDQVPILGQAKLREPFTRQIILIPDQLCLSPDWHRISAEIESINREIPWNEKISKAFWRGGISDDTGPASQQGSIHYTPRLAICRLAKQHPDLIDAAADYRPSMAPLVEKEGLKQLNGWVSKKDHLKYKYQPTLDGNMCTYPGYQWRLLSNSLTLKQESDQIQWFYRGLKPYVHYLPVRNDMSDLPEKIKWAESHESEVLGMIQNGQNFARNHLTYEDGYRYLYLVLNGYAAHQKIDFKELKKMMKKDPCWKNIQYRKRLALYKTMRKLCPF